MASKFYTLLNKLRQTQTGFAQTKRDAMSWFRSAAQQIMVSNPELAKYYYTGRKNIARIRPISDLSPQLSGRMIMFVYDPKLKKKLPYYDTFPLVMPLRVDRRFKDPRMLGLNLHYLPYDLRAKLMDSIYSLYQDRHLNENKRLQLSYQILNSSARHRWFKPCIKSYLFSHVRSRFNLVDPAEWDMVMMLPLAQFRKASESKVWADSRRKISGG